MMSEHEKESTLLQVASDLAAIKRWWPVLAAIGTIVMLVIAVTQTYDNKVAKKEDIKALYDQNLSLSKQISNLSLQVKRDSIDKVLLKAEADSSRVNIAIIEKLCGNIKKALFLGEHFYYDAQGVRHIYVMPVK
jgi:hypothetical protein